MAMLRNVFGGCVSDRSTESMRNQKIKFGAPLSHNIKNGYLPVPLVEILIYIAHEGMSTADLFRRPGNPSDTRHIVKRMTEGKPVIYQNYNMYTLASVVKKFLLRLPDGIFGQNGEETLLSVLSLGHKMEQYEAVHEYITSLQQAHQQLVSLLFGIWFTMINNCDVNFMTTEALSRSVAGSVFHSCAADPGKVEKASRIMQLLIENFGVASMFGQENIEYFADTTRTGIHIREKFRYEFQYLSEEILPPISEEGFYEMHAQREGVHEPSHTPDHSPQLDPKYLLSPRHDDEEDGDSTCSRLMAASTISAPEVSLAPSPGNIGKRPKSLEDNLNDSSSAEAPPPKGSLSRFNSVKRKQLERLRQRSDWFLGPGNGQKSSNGQTAGQSGTSFPQYTREHERLVAKSSGNSVTKASSEGAALDIISSDVDSVFSEDSRSESPASEPVRTPPIRVTRDIIHSDTIVDTPMDMSTSHESQDLQMDEDEEMVDSEVCYFVVEHKYGHTES
ncbi:rho GTPase-activating protein gacQ-like isoform X2 [Argopecten irradians]|uniref:rho GTPase-activating protein gacQ-like isoform X2 n=1 Tax=Argopecten irradians TaxID=31199 RepID=UPI003724B6D5